jgi:hypothetical protein
MGRKSDHIAANDRTNAFADVDSVKTARVFYLTNLGVAPFGALNA